jgi:hypothetical protein
MIKHLKAFALPALTFVCGGIGAFLQNRYLSITDAKGLLSGDAILPLLLWILTVVTLGFLLIFTRPLHQAPKYSYNFPPSLLGGIGATVAAVGVLLCSVDIILNPSDSLLMITAAVGLVAAAALVLSGFSRWQGKPVNVLLHSAVCLYFLLLLVCQYRMWSGEPQLQTYVFQLIATVCLMIGAYQRACFDGAMGSRKNYAFFRLAGAYFCFVAIPGSNCWYLYLTTLIWSVTDLCNLTPMTRKGR